MGLDGDEWDIVKAHVEGKRALRKENERLKALVDEAEQVLTNTSIRIANSDAWWLDSYLAPGNEIDGLLAKIKEFKE
jgi:hypothetical protein